MICEECLEPSADPVDGSRLDLCSRCIYSMQRRRSADRGKPGSTLAWVEGVHYELEPDGYVCLICTRMYNNKPSLRRHLSRRHMDALPSAAAA